MDLDAASPAHDPDDEAMLPVAADEGASESSTSVPSPIMHQHVDGVPAPDGADPGGAGR